MSLIQQLTRRSVLRTAALGLSVLLSTVVQAELPVVKVGVLKFGTVNWELNTVKHHGLDKASGFELEVVPFAKGSAAKIQLQGGGVDVIVSDWLWAARQEAEGHPARFFPWSNATGGIMVKPDSGINSHADLKGRQLGIAGGPVDKGWLLNRAFAKKTLNEDLATLVEPQFAAPPLLHKLAMKGELDAVLTFWHWGAKLQAAGWQPLTPVSELLPELGVDAAMPLLGWTTSAAWADSNADAFNGLLAASYAAKAILRDQDEEWLRLAPKVKPKSPEQAAALMAGYRAGIPAQFGETEIQGAVQIFDVLATEGGAKLVGEAKALDPVIFWSGFSIPQ